MRSPFLLLLLALAISLVISWWSHPLREAVMGGDPARQLATLATSDRDLAAALAAADRGDASPLVQWLNRAEPLERQQVGLLIVKSAAGNPPSDQKIYQQRHRLLPFVSVSTGNAEIDRTLDNALAYALVVGTASPVPEEVALAKTLADRLAAPARDGRDHALFDTIGCVRFVAGDAAAAKAAFTSAVEHATAAHVEERQLDLYRRRMAASERLATQPGERLPLEAPTP